MGKKFVKILVKGRSIKLFPQDIKKIHRKESKILPPLPSFNSDSGKMNSTYADTDGESVEV